MEVTAADLDRIEQIEQAFDLSTRSITKRELGLVRLASALNRLLLDPHCVDEAEEEGIPQESIYKAIEKGKAASKDVEPGPRHRLIGINFETNLPDRRRISTKVSWDVDYFVATVYTI